MKKDIVKLTKDTVIFNAESPKEIGEEMDLKVKLPEDVNLASFTLRGTITDCRHVRKDGTSVYILKMRIGDLPEKNRLILDAYLDFLKRGEALDKIKKDNKELQDALINLDKKFEQAIAMLTKESQGKQAIH